MKKLLIFAVSLSLTAVLPAQNVKEAVQNTKQLAQGKQMLERDVKELASMKTKLGMFNTAFDGQDATKVNGLKADILTDMAREVNQSGQKAQMARREISQSSAEIRSDRREIRNNREDSKRGRFDRKDDKRDMARDQANKRDDRRDRRDDVRDFEQQISRAERQAAILEALKAYEFNFSDANNANAKKLLVGEFVTLMEQDVAATKRELSEDSREAREDRRERRDDRNERNERDSKRKRRGGGW